MGRLEKFKESIFGIGDYAEKNWRKGLSTILDGIKTFFQELGRALK